MVAGSGSRVLAALTDEDSIAALEGSAVCSVSAIQWYPKPGRVRIVTCE